MSRYLLDTNHAGMLLRDEHAALWGRLSGLMHDDACLCQPVVAELWFMVHNSARPAANAPRLERLLAQFRIIEFDGRAAVEFGILRALLRRKGRPTPSFDVLIAAIARVNDLTLLTSDTHFRHIDGLRCEDWLSGA